MEKKMFYKASPLIFSRARELREFRRQHPLGIYIADFFCYKLKLVIEVDGPIHNDIVVKLNDEEREKNIRADGLKLIRFRNDEVLNDIESVISKIKIHLL